MIDIEDMTLELSKKFIKKNEKVTTSVNTQIEKWMETNKKRFKDNPEIFKKAQKEIYKAIEELIISKTLKKNEAVASVYDNGVIRMDFGSDVPEKVKKAATEWLKKRGLDPVEASLNKGPSSSSYTVFSKGKKISTTTRCIERQKWEIDP